MKTVNHLIPQIADTIVTSERIEGMLNVALNEVINGGADNDRLLVATISDSFGGQYQVQLKVTQVANEFIEPAGEVNLLITGRE